MLQNSTKCLCGCDLKSKKFENYKPRRMDDKFYGGRVTMEAEIECECGRKYKGYFSNKSNGLGVELIDLELTSNITQEEKIDSEPTSAVVLMETEPVAPYNPKSFDDMTYKELQAYAKENGITKVNVSKDKLIEQIKGL